MYRPNFLHRVTRGGEEWIDIAHVNVGGQRIALSLNLRVQGNQISAVLPFPENYPDSALRRHPRSSLVNISATFNGTLVDWLRVPGVLYATTRKTLGIGRTDPVLFFHSFYGVNPALRAAMTAEESAALRGIARRCMCAVLRALPRYIPNVADAAIVLQASGSVDAVPTRPAHAVSARDRRALVRRLLIERPHNADNIHAAVSTLHTDQLLLMNRRAKEQAGLERMYARAFGLQVVRPGVGASDMVGTYAEALRRCRGSSNTRV